MNIKELLGDEAYSIDDVGMSAANVILLSDKVLKIQDKCEEAENEHTIMKWLSGRLPVPQVLRVEEEEEKTYLLMTKMPGKMSCDEAYMEQPEKLTTILAEALQMLWTVDVSSCPCNWMLTKKLQIAKEIVDENRVDIDNVEPDTFGENGFKNPAALWEWLSENRPIEEPVLSHGDFCLPNIFIEDDKVSGFIDLGRCGIADKWQDIALCYRSLLHNFDGKYGGKAYEGFYPEMLFEKLGIEPDWKKIRYYILLDELF
ncbi:MAG: aminoglycoside 3'-phosphotransferase [Lachnospiraceae bacterium]|nr:aminoglycoside 3'-phosphotransferase [Lachnospiraceae bacterium]MBQ9137000.1 aminoglycoside 3'-phosphotransferase [Lachnospiraceae bacterium]